MDIAEYTLLIARLFVHCHIHFYIGVSLLYWSFYFKLATRLHSPCGREPLEMFPARHEPVASNIQDHALSITALLVLVTSLIRYLHLFNQVLDAIFHPAKCMHLLLGN